MVGCFRTRRRLFQSNANTYNATYTGAVPGLYIFAWTISNASCSSVDEVRIENYDTPTTADAGPDQAQVCSTTATMNANMPAVGVGNWSIVSQPAGQPLYYIGYITQHNNHQFNPYRISRYICIPMDNSNGVCSSSSSDVSVTMYQQPNLADAALTGALQRIKHNSCW